MFFHLDYPTADLLIYVFLGTGLFKILSHDTTWSFYAK